MFKFTISLRNIGDGRITQITLEAPTFSYARKLLRAHETLVEIPVACVTEDGRHIPFIWDPYNHKYV